ncbi:hypothetical protein ACS0PU_008663 [Formica fusca]
MYNVILQYNNKRTGATGEPSRFRICICTGDAGARARPTDRAHRALHLHTAHVNAMRETRADLTLLLCTFYGAIMERASASASASIIAENWSAPACPRQGYHRRGSQVGRQVRVN